MYAPRRKGEIEPWSREKLRWAWDAVRFTLREALSARRAGEVMPAFLSLSLL